MPLYRMQVSWGVDTAFAKDRMSINPWFNDHGATSDPEGLCDDLAAIFTGSSGWTLANKDCRVDAYLHTPGDPTSGPPVASTHLYPGANSTSTCPREVALCLSFYASVNQPGKRGRLYLPVPIGGMGPVGPRPDATQRGKVAAVGPALAGLGGADVDWVVHSVKADASYKVTNTWVDDEWDTQRSRGRTPTTRDSASVSGQSVELPANLKVINAAVAEVLPGVAIYVGPAAVGVIAGILGERAWRRRRARAANAGGTADAAENGTARPKRR